MALIEWTEWTVREIYFAQDGAIQVHQTRVKKRPALFPHGFYWYGSKRSGPGRTPKWVAQVWKEQVGKEASEFVNKKSRESICEDRNCNNRSSKEQESSSHEAAAEPIDCVSYKEQNSSSRKPVVAEPTECEFQGATTGRYSLRRRSGRASFEGEADVTV